MCRHFFHLNVSDKMKWYYFYTGEYEEWHKHMFDSLKDHFEVRPILLDTLKIHDQHSIHHFTGCTRKIELVIDCIKKNMGQQVVFSDVTWYVNRENLGKLRDHIDACAVTTYARNSHITNDLNIGLIVLSCTDAELALWESSLLDMTEATHDQYVVGCRIKKVYEHIPMLETPLVLCGLFTQPHEVPMHDVCMLKLFTPSMLTHRDRYNFRLQCMQQIGLHL